ncbi:MAG: amidohydrolase family protein [Candidatus Cryptobacteroides sp.]
MNSTETLLKGGRIYDGSASEPFVGDILISGEKIVKVAENIEAPADCEIVDISGLSVSSGFIDAHSHNDWFAIKKDPRKYFEPFVRQGFTSFITGNCGLSAIGFEADSANIDKVGGGLFGYGEDCSGVYPGAGAFFDGIDGKVPCNIAAIVGHCSARASVAGYENRKLSPEEEEQMLGIIAKSLDEGACGVSLGLMYQPGKYSQIDELKKVYRLAEKYDVPMTVHPRACSAVSMDYPLLGRAHLLRAMDELVEITKGSKGKLQYSHMIFVGRNSFKHKKELLSLIYKMRKNGVDAKFDIYDELLGVSVITVIMPAWYAELSPKAKRQWFNKLKFTILAKASILLLGFGFDDIQIAYIGPGYEKYEGKTVHQIALEEGKSDIDMYLDLCEYSDFKGRVNMGPYSTPQIVGELSKDDNVLFMTDAWVEEHGIQNPAIYDVAPKFLKHSLCGEGDTMPRTIRKMTAAVAERFEIAQRGYVKEGYYADLSIFDESALKAGTPDQSKAFGIRQVWINGHRVMNEGAIDNEALKTSGHALRRTKAGSWSQK